MKESDQAPTILCLGGHDPSGGAGIQADAEAARANGIHAVTVVSCLTLQDTQGLRGLWPQPVAEVEAQCRLILADSHVKAIKIGLLGNAHLARWVCQLAEEYPEIPMVLDPVLASGAGQKVTGPDSFELIRSQLLGHCLLATPNLPEAQALSNAKAPDHCATRLLASGCKWVLITGTHDESTEVINRLYGQDGTQRQWSWPRLPQVYHGSGCTLASAIAARLALGQTMVSAVAAAQDYTWRSLRNATHTGRGQWTPDRLYALNDPAVRQ